MRNSAVMAASLPKEMIEKVKLEAKHSGLGVSALLRMILEKHFQPKKQTR